MSSMKEDTPVIRSTAHNLPLQYPLLQLQLAEPKCDFAELYQSISINLIIKKVFWLILFNTCAYSFMWIVIHWIHCIDTYHSDKISVHRNGPVNRYTLSKLPFDIHSLVQDFDNLCINNGVTANLH